MSDRRQDVYLECTLDVDGDPLDVMVGLVSLAVADQYFVYENAGTWTFAGGVLAQIWLDRHGAHLRGAGCRRDLAWDGEPFAQVQALLADVPYRRWCAYGWAAFEMSYARDTDPNDVGRDRLLHLIVPRLEVRLTAGRAHIRSVDPGTLDVVARALRSRPPTSGPRSYLRIDVRDPGAPEYERAVERAVSAIRANALSKVVLSRVVPVPDALDFAQTYAAGRRANSPARSFLMSLDGLDALGFSPEVIVRVEQSGAVMSQPLAGTRALTDDQAENERLRMELLRDPKEIFEHALSVKTVYDELERVCEVGSLSVGEFMSVRRRGSAQHLASRVSGKLAPGRGAWDAFGAVFPTATVAGIPKAAACAHIRDSEPERRGIYGGAVLTVNEAGTLDAALVLRAVCRQNGRTWLRAGGGIVGQSTPSRELEETCEKLTSVADFLVPQT